MSVGYERADVSQPAAIEAMFASVLAGSGQVGLLVNKAGIQHVPPIDDFPVAKRDAIMAINLSAAFHTVHHVLPGMKSQRWGRILNIASAHALLASPYDSVYEGAQHGIAGLTRTGALEVADAGVTANAIRPGYVWPPAGRTADPRNRPCTRNLRTAGDQ